MSKSQVLGERLMEYERFFEKWAKKVRRNHHQTSPAHLKFLVRNGLQGNSM
jgi:hypothetical protein